MHCNRYRISFFTFFFSLASSLVSQATPPEDFYQEYSKTLSTHVDSEGYVDYEALKKDSADLDAFLSKARKLSPQEFEAWDSEDRLAFWINAYNACTLRAILDHYPIQSSFFGSLRYPKNSIRQIKGVWTDLTFPILGKKMTLDQIEHDTIRSQFQEPHIHFAVNCASKGCPRLLNTPYTADRLEQQFTEQITDFIKDPSKFRVNEKEGFRVSQLLKWYGADFVDHTEIEHTFPRLNEQEQSVVNFFFPYLEKQQQEYLQSNRFDFGYLDYDWTLNDRKEKR